MEYKEHIAKIVANIHELEKQSQAVFVQLSAQDSDSDTEPEREKQGSSNHALRCKWINLECATRLLKRTRIRAWIKHVDFHPGPLGYLYKTGERICMCIMAMPDMPTKVEGHVISRDPADVGRYIVWYDGVFHSVPPAALAPLDHADIKKRAASVKFVASPFNCVIKANDVVQIFEPFPCENEHRPWIKTGTVEEGLSEQIYRVWCPELDTIVYVYRNNLALL